MITTQTNKIERLKESMLVHLLKEFNLKSQRVSPDILDMDFDSIVFILFYLKNFDPLNPKDQKRIFDKFRNEYGVFKSDDGFRGIIYRFRQKVS